MRPFVALAGLVLAAGLTSGVSARKPGMDRYQPDPSGVFAADIAFSRLASEKGLWTAFRETAAEGAVLLVPDRQVAKEWLKGQKDPPLDQTARWQSYRAVVSCDGRVGATTGVWRRPDGAQGSFVTIWQRDRKGGWKWLFDYWSVRAEVPPAPEALQGQVAKCRTDKAANTPPPPASPLMPSQRKNAPPQPMASDDSLKWDYEMFPDGSREVRVSIWNGSVYDRVIEDRGTIRP